MLWNNMLVAAAVDAVDWDEPYPGLTAALTSDDRVLVGSDADEALHSLHARSMAAAVHRNEGLLLMPKSPRHEDALHNQFVASADLWSKSASLLPISAMLLVMGGTRSPVATSLGWMRRFVPPPTLRMLVHDSHDYGRSCADLHAIAASVSLWERFPWVVLLSGPENMLVPRDFAAIAKYIREHTDSASRTASASHPGPTRGRAATTAGPTGVGIAGTNLARRPARMPAAQREHAITQQTPRSRLPGTTDRATADRATADRSTADRARADQVARWSLDWLVFFPAHTGALAWRNVTRWCLHGFTPHEQHRHPPPVGLRLAPDVLLEELRMRAGIGFDELPPRRGSRWRVSLWPPRARNDRTGRGADGHADEPAWGPYGYHGARYVQFIERRELDSNRSVLLLPRVEDTVGWHLPLTKLTAAIDARGRVMLGADADAALAAFQPASEGLWMMATSRQAAPEFAAAAAMHALRHDVQPAKAKLPIAATLVVTNNASVRGEDLLRWLGSFQPPPRLRTILRSWRNMGYFCGELHALAAAAHVWRRFPWVLYTSGPDALLTPAGAATLARWIRQTEPNLTTPTAYLGDTFPSPPDRRRWSMCVAHSMHTPHTTLLQRSGALCPPSRVCAVVRALRPTGTCLCSGRARCALGAIPPPPGTMRHAGACMALAQERRHPHHPLGMRAAPWSTSHRGWHARPPAQQDGDAGVGTRSQPARRLSHPRDALGRDALSLWAVVPHNPTRLARWHPLMGSVVSAGRVAQASGDAATGRLRCLALAQPFRRPQLRG